MLEVNPVKVFYLVWLFEYNGVGACFLLLFGKDTNYKSEWVGTLTKGGNWNVKSSFTSERKKCSCYWKWNSRNVANKDLSSGILGLNEDFVQMNEIMG